MQKALAAMAALFLTLSVAACGNSTTEPEAVTVTSTVSPSSAKSTTEASTSAEATTEAASAPKPADSEGAGGDCLVGTMGQPQFSGTHCMDKQVASCGDPANMETGTTFFTDGTSGWTQQCANVMYPQQQQMQQTQAYDTPSEEAYEPVPTTTLSYEEASPWIQDQLDWAACMESNPQEAC